jgi:Xaa-Pro aminopeptidase
MPTTVTSQEIARRSSALRESLAAHGLDALLVAGKGHWWTGRGYLRYLTDFHLWGHDGLLLLPGDGEPGLVLTSPAVARRIAASGFVADARGDFALAPGMAAMVREAGLSRAAIGVAGYDWILPAGLFDALRAALPCVRFVTADRLFDEVRMIKSPLEIAQARELWPVMRAAMDAFEAALRPGRTRQAATAEALRAAHALGARDVLAFVGEHPADVEPPTGAPLRCDGVVRLHLEICGASGHWCECTTMYAFRDPTPAEAALEAAELAAFDAVRRAGRPGVTLRALTDVYEAALGEHGFEVVAPSHHFDLHGQGLDAIEYPRYASADPGGTNPDTPLREDMVFSYHPSRPVTGADVWGPDLHDNVLVTAAGLERLSGAWDLRWRRLA